MVCRGMALIIDKKGVEMPALQFQSAKASFTPDKTLWFELCF